MSAGKTIKVNFEGFEVTIQAKATNKTVAAVYKGEETESILSLLSMFVREAGLRLRKEGLNALSKRALGISNAIYEELDKLGLYDNVKEAK